MSYKTILVHVDRGRNANTRIRIAASMAANEGAHLIGAAFTGVSRYIYQAGLMSDMDPNLATQLSTQLDLLRRQGQEALAEFERIVRALDVPSFETELMDDEAGAGACQLAGYSDLVVIGQTDPEHASTAVMPDFPQYVVMNSGRPVLVVPYAGEFESVGKRVLAAWDGSVTATHAITNAIPLLRRADIVEVTLFNAASGGETPGALPGADMAQYLARHDIRVDVRNERTDKDIGNALLSRASDMGADLIVMGGYGHTRFRETLLGGVTRTMLESMTVPVMMSH